MGRFVPSSQLLLRDGRIPGAVKMATIWLIPKNAEKPIDRRTKEARSKHNEK